MFRRSHLAACSLLLGGGLQLAATPSQACVAGVVSEGSTVQADSQIVFIAVRNQEAATTTDVALLLNLPAAGEDFGALVPLPGTTEPTIDANALDAGAFGTLEERSRPFFEDFTGGGGDDGGLFSCGSPLAGDAVNRSLGDGGVIAAAPVTVGPVVAQWLLADDRSALNAFLADNGFTIPAADDGVVDTFIAEGKGFLVFKRSADDTTAGAQSLGVHFTVDGDLRTVPLRIAQLGAPDVLPLTVFVAHDDAVSAGNPWRTISEEDLDQGDAAADYLATLDAATNGDRLFVSEQVVDASIVAGTDLEQLIDSGDVITRLSARIPKAMLTNDALFDQPGVSPTSSASAAAIKAPRQADGLLMAALFGGLVWLGRRRRPEAIRG